MRRVFHQFQTTTLDDYVPTNNSQKAAKEIVAEYISDMNKARDRSKGLTFVGPAGVGKTMLASIVLNKAHKDGFRIEAATVSGYIDLLLRKGMLLDLIKQDEGNEDTGDDLIATDHHIRDIQGLSSKRPTDWVLFDDLGREHESQSGWTQIQIHDAIRYRYDRGMPSLVTSNLLTTQVGQRYGDSLVSFLNEVTTIVPIDGDDYRRPWSEDS